ncbi:MAG: acyl-CoA dehydrogenase family protein [Myxococcota bacterium]
MDFGLSEEQRLLQETLHRFIEERAPISWVRAWMRGEAEGDRELWQGLSELAGVGALIPDAYGGAGLGLLDAALVAQALGHGAVPAPFLAAAVMAPTAFLSAGTPGQRENWLPRIARGDVRLGVAIGHVIAPRADEGVTLRQGRLHGRSLFALDAASADAFLVALERGGLQVVERSSAGLQLEPLATIDRTRTTAELIFEDVAPLEALGGARGGPTAVTRMLDAGRIALAADTLGACDRMLAMAVDYAQERQQFGRVIGSFQAVKHLCAEMVAELEPARSLLWYAAHAFDHVPEESRLMATLAKAHLSEVGTRIAKTSTEVHGGIGFTDEHDLHLWFKRIGLNRQLLGSPQRLRRTAARLQGWDRSESGSTEDLETPLL